MANENRNNSRPAHGPGGGRTRGPRPKVENPGKLLKRVLSLIFRHYGWACGAVALCIVGTALATVQGSLFLKSLIDDYIEPMLSSGSRDFGPLAAALLRIAAIYGVGVLCAWAQSRIMITVSQGTLRDLRVQVFQHMESLPISYFDTHAHGDIMSVYTNDIDTLRQMISQSLPDLASSLVTIISVFVSMVILNVPLTVLTCVMVAVILLVSQYLAKNSARFFVEQQKNLGSVNGYIEEMMEGQKVVKVFCHEQENLEGFLRRNEALRIRAAFETKGCKVLHDSPTNQQFFVLPDEWYDKLAETYAMTHMGKPDKHHTAVRVCTSWATKDEAVEQLIADVKGL